LVGSFKKLNTLRTPTKNQLFNAKNPMSLRASSAEFLRQPAGQPASQSGPLSALLSKENALKKVDQIFKKANNWHTSAQKSVKSA